MACVVKSLIFFMSIALLSSCQQVQLRALENGGAIRVEPSEVAGADYVVHIRNGLDSWNDPDDPQNREKLARQVLEKQCAKANIVKQSMIETGTFAFGRPSRTYSVYVRCH